MPIDDAIPYEQPIDRYARLRHTVENYDEQADAQWELEMEMDPDANLPGDATQTHDDDEPFRRSPSPDMMAARIHPVETIAHRRSPSVEIMDQSPAPSVRIIDPPLFGPSGSTPPSNLLALPEEVDAWAVSVRVECESHPRGVAASIRATSAQAVAKTFIAVLTDLLGDEDLTGPPFRVAPGTTHCTKNVQVASFARDDCDFRV